MQKTLIDPRQFVAFAESEAITTVAQHRLSGHSLYPPFPESYQYALFAMGCFWGAERRFWQQSGVYVTAVGYAGGAINKPNYPQVCSGLTGHTEAVLVVFDPAEVSFAELLE